MTIQEKWDKVEKYFEYIHRNLDICWQDLCEGQESKHKLEEEIELLADIRSEIYENSSRL